MTVSNLLLITFTITEIFLMVVVIFFFLRLKKSEELISKVQSNQEQFVNKLHFNAQLEQEMIETFSQRQKELAKLDQEIEAKEKRLRKLVKHAEQFCSSPQYLRQIILNGAKQGRSSLELAKATGLSVDEVELIMEQDL
ncbi:MAG: hypothetical protein ACNI27_05035 [Desulfovibrio sp.]